MEIIIGAVAAVFIVIVSQHLGWWPVHQIIEVEQKPEEFVYVVKSKDHLDKESFQTTQEIQAVSIGMSPEFIHFLDSRSKVVLVVPNRNVISVEMK